MEFGVCRDSGYDTGMESAFFLTTSVSLSHSITFYENFDHHGRVTTLNQRLYLAKQLLERIIL